MGAARGRRPVTKELWFFVAVALVVALLMKTFLLQAFFIPSESMEKTLHGCPGCQGDRVLVNKVVYRFREPRRGEIVVFSGKGTPFQREAPAPPPANAVQRALRGVQRALGLGSPDDTDFIKRVIGVPGDVVACCTGNRVTVNGQPLEEPYVFLSEPGAAQKVFGPLTVPEHMLFVMGDHRDRSLDSRFNGPIPQHNVIGRAFAVFFPLSRVKRLLVPAPFETASVAVLALPLTGLRRRLRRTTD